MERVFSFCRALSWGVRPCLVRNRLNPALTLHLSAFRIASNNRPCCRSCGGDLRRGLDRSDLRRRPQYGSRCTNLRCRMLLLCDSYKAICMLILCHWSDKAEALSPTLFIQCDFAIFMKYLRESAAFATTISIIQEPESSRPHGFVQRSILRSPR